jgi:hypothetical protein
VCVQLHKSVQCLMTFRGFSFNAKLYNVGDDGDDENDHKAHAMEEKKIKIS